jgi:hypothetical protein
MIEPSAASATPYEVAANIKAKVAHPRVVQRPMLKTVIQASDEKREE